MLSIKSKKARIIRGGKSAWWYDEKGAISIHIFAFGTTLVCSIKRSELLKYLHRSKK